MAGILHPTPDLEMRMECSVHSCLDEDDESSKTKFDAQRKRYFDGTTRGVECWEELHMRYTPPPLVL
ncbi:hypothetical protein T265_12289 [Opisthorchis viverrini]|uniref:Uncharacterized protein n=1 Tax=Opisthorchis viverrini TaxID=6198 RepID=A0A074Z4Z7_OPIVI|nr:hypothetical protein T265_12289 [Opisthorchis viverrini]KER18385.1 hypothetical protein T265_12289 [Opisthorchis viverrini]